MGYRILTGALIPICSEGETIINFNPYQVTGDAESVDPQELGDQGDFHQPPSGFVSLKHITMHARTDLAAQTKQPNQPPHSAEAAKGKELALWPRIRRCLSVVFQGFVPRQDKQSPPSSTADDSADNRLRTAAGQFQLINQPPTIQQMVIKWKATNGGEIKEIGYMIVGEA